MANAFLVVLLLAGCAVWGIAVALRVRRRRYLTTNRPRVIEESLRRAKTKLGEQEDPPGPTLPGSPADG